MSSRTCSASSSLLAPFFTFGPSSFFTYVRSNAAVIGRMDFMKSAIGSRSSGRSTPHTLADT
jgi:hypothetical protein